MLELYIDISFLLPSAVGADATRSDGLGLVFGQDGMYIRKALRGHSGRFDVPQHYTADRSALGKMLGVANRLKQLNPQLMEIKPDTIRQFTKRVSKSNWKSSVAYYQPYCEECFGTGEKFEKLRGANYFEMELSNQLKLVPCTKCVNGFSPHVYVAPDFLRSPVVYIDRDEALALGRPEWEGRTVVGDFALILLTCHECAHDLSQHQKYHHGKKWKFWFSKFLHQIMRDIT